MKNFVMTGTQKIAFDAMTGSDVAGMTKLDMTNAIKKAISDACGGEWNYYQFQKNRYDVFQIISEIMPVAMHASLGGKFDQFAEFKDTAMGDKNYFVVEDNILYPVYTVARGDGDVERQKIIDRNFSVSTVNKEIKLYDELDMFMSGRMSFERMVAKATDSYANYVGLLVSDTIYASYSAVDTNYKATGSYDADTLMGLMEQVKAATGATDLQIWGTSTALANISDGFGYSDNAKDMANNMGYWGEFRGASLYAMPQAYRPKSTTLAVNTSHIIILPANEKICKVVFEGDAFVGSTEAMDRNDRQIEFVLGRRVGAAAITVPEGKYGFYKFT